MASGNMEEAEAARLRGNELYKKAQLNQAIKAYSEAFKLDVSNYLPLSNLSAAYFESGKYRDAIDFANKALQIMAEGPESEPPKQRLFVRMAKSFLYLRDLDSVESIVDKIAADGERANLRLSLEIMRALQGGDKGSSSSWSRSSLMTVPRYKPQMVDEAEYFCVGHDIPESQLTDHLVRNLKPNETVSIMLCGIGDARNMFQTILEFPVHESRRLHFFVLDHKPAVVARNLIFFHLFNEAATENDESKAYLTFCVLSYLFTVPILPPFVWEKLQTTIRALLNDLEDEKQPLPWVRISNEDMKALCSVFRQWQPDPMGPYSTKAIRPLVARDQLFTSIELWEPADRLDYHFFHDFGTVMLPLSDAEKVEPHIAELLKAYGNKVQGGKSRLSTYINRTWRTNMTMIDVDWESKRQAFETPDMSMNPLMTADILTKAIDKKLRRKMYKKGSIVDVIARYFKMIGPSFIRIRNRLQVEVRIDEMANALECLRHDLLQRPDSDSDTASGDRAECPKRFHVIHMSNIPDYTGGALTSFLYGAPLLETGLGTGLTTCVLKNPPRWKSINQYLAEYLLMYDRKLVETHFRVKLSRTTPAGYQEAMYPLMPYYKWERVAAAGETLGFEELMPQAALARWLYAHFLKICIPYERGPNFDLVYAPFNLTVFMRLLVHASELGYPSHWLSALINGLLSGEVTTTARAPRRYVLTPQDVDEVYPPRKMSVAPWTMELAALVSLWLPLFPFGLVTTSSKLLASSPDDEIEEYTVQFPPSSLHGAFGSGYVPHFMLVFWNQRKLRDPPVDMRPLLLDDEAGDAVTQLARQARSEVLRILTTFKWSTDARTATFWLRRSDMAEMVGEDWHLYVWRTDSWDRESDGLALKGAKVTSRPFGKAK